MSDDEKRYKMVNGELIEMTPEEIAELASAGEGPSPPNVDQPAPKEEKPDARSRPRR